METPHACCRARNPVGSREPRQSTEQAQGEPLRLPASDFERLLRLQGPSLALWRGAEIAALREQRYTHPILDLGCGDGLVTSMVLPQVEYGVDPDVRALQQAAGRGVYQHLLSATGGAMSLPDESIATVMSNSVIEHLTDLDATLAAVSRVLVPGGRFIFTTPTDSFSEWLAVPFPGYAAWRNRQLAHWTLMSSEAWTVRLRGVGLAVENVRPYLGRDAVWIWDVLELLQQIWIGDHRLVSLIWKRLPAAALDGLAERYAALDLSAAPLSGGHLIVARKL